MKLTTTAFLFLLLTSATLSFSQTAKIVGKVLSAKTGEALIGATVSIEKIKKAFGYEPKVDLKEGIRLTVDWFLSSKT